MILEASALLSACDPEVLYQASVLVMRLGFELAKEEDPTTTSYRGVSAAVLMAGASIGHADAVRDDALELLRRFPAVELARAGRLMVELAMSEAMTRPAVALPVFCVGSLVSVLHDAT